MHREKDPSRWDQWLHSLDVQLRFPPTNTTAAKRLRVAASLHVIARRISTDIFIPCYFPKSVEVSEAIKDILAAQFETDRSKERITRALLLSTYMSKEMETVQKVVNATSKDIAQRLDPIGANGAFCKAMEQVLHEAANVWKEAQYSMKLVEASADDDFENWPWAQSDEFNSPVTETKAQVMLPNRHMLIISPRVYVPEDHSCVFPGYTLFPNQDIVLAAEHEYSQWKASKSKNGRTGSSSGVPRRLSVRQAEGNGMKPEERPTFSERKQHQLLGSGSHTKSGGRGEG